MKEIIGVYPLTQKTLAPILMLLEKSEQYTIEEIITPPGILQEGWDIGMIQNRDCLGYKVTNNFERALCNCDTMIFLDSGIAELEKDTIEKMKFALTQNRKTVCCLTLEEVTLRSVQARDSAKFIYLHQAHRTSNKIDMEYKEVQVPVVMIGKLSDDLDSQGIFLRLVEWARKDGYSVAAITSDVNAQLFGCHLIPDEFFHSKLQEENKIILFNHFVNSVARQNHADIVFIEIPRAMVKYNNIVSQGFGIYPFYITNAVAADYFILNAPYNFNSSEYFKLLNDVFRYRFGFQISYICISNLKLDISSYSSIYQAKFEYLPEDLVKKSIAEQYSQNEIPVISDLDEEGLEKLYAHLMATLCNMNMCEIKQEELNNHG